ncbi:glutamate racemase [Flavobacterium agricola]|uniref:Glutamate racemase n=1 Tax=Flavobacterium agricola TaxID=2870839 RepID=A0ABY6LWU7_9FLAO|nr:glutamate racemase [Flavobacterium agricola]UYW00746.1 glutamate racemase [Flavobacterium agricola]
MSTENTIGIFDSGIGGTSIWKEINHLLPYENTIYLADTKNAPYGTKSKDEIIAYSIKNTEFLLNKNAKLVVVACNTATLNAVAVLREKFDVPFIGLEPAIKPAALQSQTKNIGVLATQASIQSENFKNAVLNFPDVNIIPQIGYNLVQLIEQGHIDSPEMDQLLQQYVQPMVEKNIDYLVLGCTHYPYLFDKIKAIVPPTVQIIDSGEAVAKQTKHILESNKALNLSNKMGQNLFYTNGNATVLKSILGFTTNVFESDF